MTRDWKQETENLTEREEFVNLNAGKHRIRFLDDGVDKVVNVQGKDINKVYFRVNHAKKDDSFTDVVGLLTVTKGDKPTLKGFWGQLTLFANQEGSLVGKEVTVIVTGSGTDKSYTVVEAAGLTKDKEELVE